MLTPTNKVTYVNGVTVIGADNLNDIQDSVLANTSSISTLSTSISSKQDISNLVTSLSASSTDTQYPSAKCVYDNVVALIPSQATSSNQLADKSFVNSSIATNTANYISDNGSPFTSLAALQAYSGTLTNNDYAFVKSTDSVGNTTYTRYKYSSSSLLWAEEYVLNNSSFTAVQWAAINSGITSAIVSSISNKANKTASDLATMFANGATVLSSYQYGDSLPSTVPAAGTMFFVKA